MFDEDRISELVGILNELAEVSGGFERTRIAPNLVVVDNVPTNLSTDYILIEDDEGFYIPAVKVPGVTYSIGDKVNVLFIKGTEPIAFQHGSASGGGGGGGGWPFTDTPTADGTDPDADYSTLAAGITGISAGQRLLIGSNFAEYATLNKVMTLVGTTRDVTVSSSTRDETIRMSAAAILERLTVENTYTTSLNSAVAVLTDGVILDSIIASVPDGNTGDRYGINIGAACTLFDCRANLTSYTGNNGITIYVNATGKEIHIYGGRFEASGAGTNYALSVEAGTVYLHNTPTFIGLVTAGINGSIIGEYIDSSGNLIFSTGGGESAGVWRHRADGLRIKEDTYYGAVANAASGDVIRLYPGTYSYTSYVDIGNKSITIEGESPESTIITSNVSGSPTFYSSLLSGAATITFRNVTIQHTGAGANSGPLATNQTLILDNVVLEKLSGAPSTGYALWLYGGTTTIRNGCRLKCTSGTSKYGIFNDTAATTLTVEGGSIEGTTQDIYSNQAGSSVILNRPLLVTASQSWAGTMRGEGVDQYGRTLRLKPIGIADARLTLSSGVPVPHSDVTAATNIYLTPYTGSKIEVYNGYFWIEAPFTELTLSLSGFTANKNSDVWVYDNAGTLALERTEWTNDTTRATAVVLQDGRSCKSGALTRLYCGTFRTTGTTGQCEDSVTSRFVWNRFNQEKREMFKSEATTHNYAGNAYRAWNNDTTQFIAMVLGFAAPVSYLLSTQCRSDSTAAGTVSIVRATRDGFAANFQTEYVGNYNQQYVAGACGAEIAFGVGYHTINVNEFGGTNGSDFVFMTLAGVLLG